MNRDDPAAPVAEEEEEEEEEEAAPVLADEEMMLSGEEEPESDDDEDSNLDDDDDDDDSDDDGEVEVPLKVEYFNIHAGMTFDELRPLIRRFTVLNGLFNDPLPRFANAGSTAGVLRLYAEEDQEEGERRQKYILLLYRYTGFAVSRGGEVEVRRSTKLHQLRFDVPRGGDAAEALRWAGPAMGPLVYPAAHAGPLRELWSVWASDLRVPPRAARVHLLADVVILRRRHYTLARMEQVCARLGRIMAEPWRGYHVAMELRLPEPVVPRRPCEDGGKGKGKEKEECPVCLEELESGLVRWPGCLQPHVFHGECLELSLKESDKCPVCRRRLLTLIDG